MNKPDEDQVMALVAEVGKKPAYRAMGIPETTLRDLASRALERQPSARMALKTMRRKLHQISAPYLGDPDYTRATTELQAAFQDGNSATLDGCCRGILSSHTSTRERLLVLEGFYQQLFSLGGQPSSILDLACGLNPLTWRWMGLPASTHYLAYDIHAPRVSFLNAYFQMEGLSGEAILRDILVEPPTDTADAAFLFKEAHRFEEREAGCNRDLWRALNVKTLYVSLPPFSMTGRHNLTVKNRKLIVRSLSGEDWQVSELNFPNEQVFVIEK
jgi:16S rRNA (guanine(1405)-N(7))-methyltransferase